MCFLDILSFEFMRWQKFISGKILYFSALISGKIIYFQVWPSGKVWKIRPPKSLRTLYKDCNLKLYGIWVIIAYLTLFWTSSSFIIIWRLGNFLMSSSSDSLISSKFDAAQLNWSNILGDITLYIRSYFSSVGISAKHVFYTYWKHHLIDLGGFRYSSNPRTKASSKLVME